MISTNYLKTIFLIFWLILALIGLFFGYKAYINGDLGLKHDLEFSNFHICSSSSVITTEVKIISLNDIEENTIQLFACGVIQSNKPESLNIYVYQESENRLIYKNETGDLYPPGALFFPLDLSMIEKVGVYKVVVYYYRNIIGTASFDVIE